MAIVHEDLGNGFVRTYSNSGFKVHGGIPEGDYDVIYHPEGQTCTYVETNIPAVVDPPPPPPPTKVYSKLKILMAAEEAGFSDQLIDMLESGRRISYIWNASNTIEDNALLRAYVPDIATVLGKTEQEVMAFLDEYCQVD